MFFGAWYSVRYEEGKRKTIRRGIGQDNKLFFGYYLISISSSMTL